MGNGSRRRTGSLCLGFLLLVGVFACGDETWHQGVLPHQTLASPLRDGDTQRYANLKAHRNLDLRVERGVLALQRQPLKGQVAEVNQLKGELGGLTVRFNAMTGATKSVSHPTGYLSQRAPGVDPLLIAEKFVQGHLDLLGLLPDDLLDYEITDRVFSRVTGATHIYLRQRYQGIPVYNGQMQIHINRDGRVIAVNNDFVPNLAQAVANTKPGVGADSAVAFAAEHIGAPLFSFPTVLTQDAGPSLKSTVNHQDLSLKPIVSELMLLPVGGGEVRLVWRFQLHTLDQEHAFDMTVDAASGDVWTRFDWVAQESYRVYPLPAESPNHVTLGPPADGRTLIVDPANASASPYGWHDTDGAAGAEFTIPRGNNVHAYEDTDNNNGPPASEPDCGAGLACDFSLDLTQPPSAYIPAAVANLFYWNNIVHDVQYQYGFDEEGGNFQANNYGQPGSGGDAVDAEAQDGGGTNNANFLTPPDGQKPRMQMYIWTAPTPDKDGDLDNGIIIHEFGHGISNRQVGGPSNTSCLGSSQQPGEGWSDWFSLAYTHEPGDAGTDPRGIGTYALDEPVDGPGIRTQRYSTDPAVNTWTYESIRSMAVPHGVGSVWAQATWEVYWALVAAHGFDADLYNASGGAGNQRMMLYVNEGMKNTACSPTFLDARDGIIQAVTDNFGGEDVCLVWEAFAAFGLGTDASTTGSNSSATNGFEIPLPCRCQPAPIADAGPDHFICLGDSATLGTPAQPDNTYLWSPGGETTPQITVSPTTTTDYTVTATTAACGSDSDSARVVVDDGTGGGLSDDFESGASGWTTTGLWHLVANSTCATPGYSSPVSAMYYGSDTSCNYDTGSANNGELTSPDIFGINASSTLEFDYFRQVESYSGAYDKTEVAVSSDGASWTTVWSRDSSTASENAWTASGAIDLSAYAGSTIKLRFRFDTVDGASNAFVGWMIDDVVVTGTSPCGGGNNPPSVSISAPTDGQSFTEGTSVAFAGTANDVEDGDITANLAWTSSLDGAIGNGGSFNAVLSVGNHNITAAVSDSGGLNGDDAVAVTVTNVAPTVTITAPADGSTFEEGTSIDFAGAASDPGDGDLSGQLQWTSSLDGNIGNGASFSALLSVGSHTITAAVSDTNGASGEDTLSVTVTSTGGGGLSEDFESGATGWTTSGLWHLVANSTCANPGYSSPVNAMYYGQDASCNYNSGASNTGDLISPAITGITAASSLNFDYFRQVESYSGSYDRTEVAVSTDEGATWTTVWSRDSQDASENAWTASGAISLSAYAGAIIKVRFLFNTVDSSFNDFVGWFIDDVVVN